MFPSRVSIAAPLPYRPQLDEPELVTGAPVRLITGFSGAGKTAWVSQSVQHSRAHVAYFDIGDAPATGVAIPLARELAGQFFGRGGGLGQVLLPGATGLEMLRAITLRLRSERTEAAIVIDNTHRVAADAIREILAQMSGLSVLLLSHPGPFAQEFEAITGVVAEPLRGWGADIICRSSCGHGGKPGVYVR